MMRQVALAVIALVTLAVSVARAQTTAAAATAPGVDRLGQMARLKEYSEAIGKCEGLIKQIEARCASGRPDQAEPLLAELIKTWPGRAEWDIHMHGDGPPFGQRGADRLSWLADWLLERGELGLAKGLIEQIPETAPGKWQRLYPPLKAPEQDQVEFARWLEKRGEQSEYWLGNYVRCLGEMARYHLAIGKLPTPADVVSDLEQQVRQHPADVRLVRRLVAAVSVDNSVDGRGQRVDRRGKYNWMGQICRPPNATDYAYVAACVLYTGSTDGAIELLQVGLKAPFTEVDRERVLRRRSMLAVVVSAAQQPSPEQEMRAAMRSELLRCYQLAGRAKEAEALTDEMQAATGTRPVVGPRSAGQMELASGKRDVEDRIKQEEAAKGTTPSYWLERAKYYEGRRDLDAAEAAYAKALAVAAKEGTPNAVTKRWVLSEYIHFVALARRNPAGAYALMWKEAVGFPTESKTALLEGLRFLLDNETIALGDDQRLWDWLADCPKWTIAHLRVIEKMMEHPGRVTEDQVLDKAADLAKDADPSRALLLAEALCMAGHEYDRRRQPDRATAYVRRAVPLLESGLDRSKPAAPGNWQTEGQQRSGQMHLRESYMRLELWQKALDMYPEDASAAVEAANPPPVQQLALCAAKVGDKARAMRYWARASAVDRTALNGLKELADAGCRDELIAFYERLGQQDPNNTVPAKALAVLRPNQ